jgi:hypothetical protein
MKPIFFNPPLMKSKTFIFGKDFKKIEVKIFKYRGSGPNKVKMPGKISLPYY